MVTSDSVRRGIREYRASGRRRVLYAAILVVVIALICVYSLSISRVDISFTEALRIVWNHIIGDVPLRSENYHDWWIDQVVVNDNAPRTIAGICVGVILAVSGAIMHSVTRNPLTDPYTMGISSAALFGTTISIVFGICVVPWLSGDSAQVANAFVFALIPALAVVVVSGFKRTTPTMMILIGIAVMYMFNAFTTFIKFNAEAEEIHEIYEWSLGTLSKVDWGDLVPLCAAAIVITVAAVVLSRRIDIVSLGEAEAKALGENPTRVRLVCFVLISVATAVAVCYTGTIGFVGLVAPHVARLFAGNSNRILIPTSAIVGALMVVGADCLVRMLPNVLPVGVITALIGSPLFLYFLYRQRRRSTW